MPPKPSAAAWRSVSTGKSSSSSHWRANGIISSRAKARAVSWMARCSSVSSKSMPVTGVLGGRPRPGKADAPDQFPRRVAGDSIEFPPSVCREAKRSSEHPRGRILNRLVVIEQEQALDVAHQRPDEPPEQHQNADDNDRQHDADHQIQYSDPERPDLKLVMRARERVGLADFDVRDDDADQRCYSGDVG